LSISSSPSNESPIIKSTDRIIDPPIRRGYAKCIRTWPNDLACRSSFARSSLWSWPRLNDEAIFERNAYWVQKVGHISPVAWNVISRALPVLSDILVKSWFHKVKSVVSSTPPNMRQVGKLTGLWIWENQDTKENEKVVLSADTVAFQRLIMACENGTIDNFSHVFKINPDLFDQFSQESQARILFWRDVGIRIILDFLYSDFNRWTPRFIFG
jgi:hypothetical protein